MGHDEHRCVWVSQSDSDMSWCVGLEDFEERQVDVANILHSGRDRAPMSDEDYYRANKTGAHARLLARQSFMMPGRRSLPPTSVDGQP